MAKKDVLHPQITARYIGKAASFFFVAFFRLQLILIIKYPLSCESGFCLKL